MFKMLNKKDLDENLKEDAFYQQNRKDQPLTLRRFFFNQAIAIEKQIKAHDSEYAHQSVSKKVLETKPADYLKVVQETALQNKANSILEKVKSAFNSKQAQKLVSDYLENSMELQEAILVEQNIHDKTMICLTTLHDEEVFALNKATLGNYDLTKPLDFNREAAVTWIAHYENIEQSKNNNPISQPV